MSDAATAEHLAKKYPDGTWGAVDITFTAPRAQITVLVGPNGAGKTTTIGMLTTILRPTRGKGQVAGHDITKEPWKVRRKIAIVPQEARVDLNWTPLEAVKWYLVARGWSTTEASQRAKEILEKIGLWEKRNQPGWGLSGGQRRKTIVAMALATDAEVIFLDEPTTGLDVESRYAVWDIVRRTVSEEGRTIILTTHDMKEAETLADNAVLISRGRVVATGPPTELRKTIPYQYRVLARKPRAHIDTAAHVIRIGDLAIYYAETRGEAAAIASQIDAETVTIEPVSFEDIYLYHLRTEEERKEVIKWQQQ